MIKKNINNNMDYMHVVNNIEANNPKPRKEMIIEDVDEEREAKFEPLVSYSKGHHLGMLPEGLKRDKGKNILIDK